MIKVAINASRSRSGGAVTHLKNILSKFDPKKSEFSSIHVWCDPEMAKHLPSLPWLKLHFSPSKVSPIWSQIFWEAVTLKREIDAHGCDICLNVDAGTFCRFTPSVTMSRDMLSFEKKEAMRFGFSLQFVRIFLLRYVQIFALRRATAVVFLTDYASKKIQSVTGPLKWVELIGHGVDEAFFKGTSKQKKCKGTRAVYVSNALPYKHHEKVVEAVKLIRERGDDVELTLIGVDRGLATEKLFSLINEVDGEENFIFVFQHSNHETIRQILKENDVILFASTCENMPNTLLEGMASGVPIISSNYGPMPEILGDCGLYFDPENVNSLITALSCFIDNPNRCLKMAADAQKRAKLFSWEDSSNKMFDLLMRVVSLNKMENR